MATAAQIVANQLNAQASTGPRTNEGKSKCAGNATRLGLFSMHDLVRPEEEPEYQALVAGLWSDLLPDGALQESIAVRIVRATWRLERCARVEGSLLDSMLETGLDPMQNEANVKVQNAVDRARTSAENSIRRATAKLRRLQTERQIARETFREEPNPPSLGLTSMKEVLISLQTQTQAQILISKVESANREALIMQQPDPSLAALCIDEYFAKQSQSVAA